MSRNRLSARADWDTHKAEGLHPDGTWTPTDYLKATEDGREVTEAKVLSFRDEQQIRAGRFHIAAQERAVNAP